jgi:hypothetical protein
MSLWGDDKATKRTLGIRDRQILWIRAKKKCENCGKSLEFHEMQIGHKTAWSKGGSTSVKNSVVLCYACNKLQGTDSWTTFQKKQGRKVEESNPVKTNLKDLTLTQLKKLAREKHITLKGKTEEGLLFSKTIPPTRSQYVNALSSKITEKEISSLLAKKEAKTVKKKKRITKKKNEVSLF